MTLHRHWHVDLLFYYCCIDIVTSGDPLPPDTQWQPLYLYPRTFDVHETAEANAHLRDMGFVVYRQVLSTEQVNAAMSMFWDFFEGLNLGFKRNYPSTLTQKRHGDMFSNGLFTGCAAGHSSFMWYLRDLPQVRQIFSGIWDTSNLLVSFDGILTFRQTDSSTKRERWYHCDLQPLRINNTGIPMVQGLMNLLPVSEDSGGLVIVPGSHDWFGHIANQAMPSLRQKYFASGEADHYFDLSGMTKFDEAAVHLHLEPGDFVVWDGRTVHCNVPPRIGVNLTDQLFRAAALITMAPHQNATPEILKARREAVCKGVTLTHWPTEFVPVDQPQGGTRSLTPSSCLFHGPPSLSDNQLELIGLSQAERHAWVWEPESRCPGTVYPSKVPAMRSIWSSRVLL